MNAEVRMKLIYAQGACSLAVHILLEEIGFKYDSLKVSLQDKTVLEKYNEKSYVPVLILPSGETLTEAITILEYLGDHYQRHDLYPEPGTFERARCNEWLTYLSTEIHKGMGPLFHRKDLTDTFLNATLVKLTKRFDLIDRRLSENDYLLGEEYSIADMYCLALLRIAEHIRFDLSKFPHLIAYKQKLESHPIIDRVIKNERTAQVATVAA